MGDNPNDSTTSSELDGVEFYWRPGCPFCSGLDRKLSKLGVPMNKHNIWENPDHAATVRSIANGNETVPTVVIEDVKMVNPSADEVVQVLTKKAPHLVPEDWDPNQGGKRMKRLFGS